MSVHRPRTPDPNQPGAGADRPNEKNDKSPTGKAPGAGTPNASGKKPRRRPGWKPAALRSAPLHPAPVAAKFEDLEDLFAPSTAPEDIEYGAQPPG